VASSIQRLRASVQRENAEGYAKTPPLSLRDISPALRIGVKLRERRPLCHCATSSPRCGGDKSLSGFGKNAASPQSGEGTGRKRRKGRGVGTARFGGITPNAPGIGGGFCPKRRFLRIRRGNRRTDENFP
jgi:hypothetical protein